MTEYLCVWAGVVAAMAKIIEYYIREGFRKKKFWMPLDQRGKIING